MGVTHVKTTYNVEGAYGSVDKKTLYAAHYRGCDIVNFYDDDGSYIMSVEDTMENNLLDAINRAYGTSQDTEDVKVCFEADLKKLPRYEQRPTDEELTKKIKEAIERSQDQEQLINNILRLIKKI